MERGCLFMDMDAYLEQDCTDEKRQILRNSHIFTSTPQALHNKSPEYCSAIQINNKSATAMTPNKPNNSRFFNSSNSHQRHSFPRNAALLNSTPIHYQYNTATDQARTNANQPILQHQDDHEGYTNPLIPHNFIDLKYQQFGYPNPEFSENSLELLELPLAQEFPASFNPREAASMHHREKVNDWIKRVPIYYLADGQFWYNDCYPGAIPTSSSVSDSVEDMDFVRYNQNASITGFEFDDSELFVDHEDVLEFQARKITKYVKKIYHMDQGEPTKKGIRSFITVDGFDRSQFSIDPDPNLEVTNTSYNLNLTEVFDQINSKNNLLEEVDNFVMNNADDLDLEKTTRYTGRKSTAKRAGGLYT